jgi:predicted anti-sigma-YlaC factor YlaD
MPDCDEIVALLSEYLDRDLPQTTCEAIDAHLARCLQCEDAVVGLRRTVDLCRRFRAEDQPSPLTTSKQQELRGAFEKALESMRQRRSR